MPASSSQIEILRPRAEKNKPEVAFNIRSTTLVAHKDTEILTQESNFDLTDSVHSSEIQQEFHAELIRLYNKKFKDIQQLKTLLKESYSFRRNLINNGQNSFLEMLQEFPYFKEVSFCELEFAIVTNIQIEVVCNEIEKTMKKLWSFYQITSKDKVNGFVSIIKKLESDVKAKKKQESIIYIGKRLDANNIAAPRIHFNNNKLAIVFQEVHLCDIEECIFEHSVALLFAYYFIFDLKYPEVFTQILGFFHEILFSFEEVQFVKTDTVTALSKYLISERKE